MTSAVRLLVVDGEEAVRSTVAEHLPAFEDRISVATAADVATARQYLGEAEFDCLLTEASPPGSERLAFVEQVAGSMPALPVVVFDEGLADGVAGEAAAAGAATVLPRTTDPETLRLVADRVTAVATDDGDRGDLADAAPVGIWLLRDDTVAYANPACGELFGQEPDDLAGRSVRELVADGDAEVVGEHVEALVSGEETERADVVTGLGRWNERRRLELRSRRVDAGDGPAIVGTVTDVSTAELNERRLTALFDGLNYPIAHVALEDGRAVVRQVNPAFEEVFGVEGTALVGDPIDEHVVPDEEAYETALDVYVRAERGARVVEEVTRATADGERTFQVQALPFRAGEDPHAYLVYGGTTKRTQRERSLTELQAVSRELMEADDFGEIARIGVEAAERVFDTELACLYQVDDGGEALVPLAATEGAEALFGDLPVVPEGEGAAWYVHELGDAVVTDDVRSLDTVMNEGTQVRSEMLLPIGDHGVFIASATEAGVFDEEDEALARTLASTLEAAFNRAAKDELLREREQELVRENERLEEFAGIVSHDLRSPLAVVKGNLNLLRDEGDEKYLNRIEAAADRMEALIEDLLSLARQGSMVDEPEFVDLADVVNRAWGTADTRAARLEADVDASLKADPSRLQQLLENLFNNAVEHGGEDVGVRVGIIRPDDDRAPGGQYGRDLEGFFVADDGPGLPEEKDDLFEPGTTTDEDGTGFGLAIVQRIAEAHGWEVTTTESAAGGARFEFTGVEGV